MVTRAMVALLLVPLVPATERPGKRICVVLDVSGSMDSEGKITAALGLVQKVTRQPVDDGYLTAVAFDEGASRYPGGWVRLPDAEGAGALEQWLADHGVGGGTRLCPALVKALAEPHKGLCVVVVTDGLLPYEGPAEVLGCLDAAQAKRVRAGLGKAVVGVLGVGHREAVPVLRKLAERGGGGYWVGE